MAERRSYASEHNRIPKHAAVARSSDGRVHAHAADGEAALFSVPLSEVRRTREPAEHASWPSIPSSVSRAAHRSRFAYRDGASSGELLREAGALTCAVNLRMWRRAAAFVVAAAVLVVACVFTWGYRALSAEQTGEAAQEQIAEQAASDSASVQEVSQNQEQADVSSAQTTDSQQNLTNDRSALSSMGQGNMPYSPQAASVQETGFVNLVGASANVPALFQYPSMPAGCEVYSLAAVLAALDANADPDDIVATYLPFSATGDDYATAFWGDPYSEGSGMPPAIMIAGNAVLQDTGATERFENATGASFDDLANLANSGSPVLVWATLDFVDPFFDEPLEPNSPYYPEHCVVLLGAQGDDAYLMDPTQGYTTVSYSWLKYLYEQCGSMALKLA